jgi:ABC-type enterobactin transport system permease subunit
VIAALIVLLLVATGASLALGAVKVPIGEVLDILLGKGGSGPNH